MLNLKQGRFAATNGAAQLTSSGSCYSDDTLWMIRAHPTEAGAVQLRNKQFQDKAVDIWTGYSVLHHNAVGGGTQNNVFDLKFGVGIKNKHVNHYITMNDDGTIGAENNLSSKSVWNFIIVG